MFYFCNLKQLKSNLNRFQALEKSDELMVFSEGWTGLWLYLVWADPHIFHDCIKLSEKPVPQSVIEKEKATRFDVIYSEVLIHYMDHWPKATKSPNWSHEWEGKVRCCRGHLCPDPQQHSPLGFDVPQRCYFGLVTRQLCLWVTGELSAAPSSVSSFNRLNTIAKHQSPFSTKAHVRNQEAGSCRMILYCRVHSWLSCNFRNKYH